MMQGTAADAKAAEKVANAALATAEKALEELRTSQGGKGAVGNVRVEQTAAGITISIPDEDGDPQVIVLSSDGHQIKSIENMSASAIMPRRDPNEMPKSVMVIALFSIAAGVMILSPLVRSLGRILDRRGQASSLPNDSARRLEAIEQAVEAVAVEVERISEGQRFVTQIMAKSQQDKLPVGRTDN